MAKQAALPALLYMTAAVAVLAFAYTLQPRFCTQHLLLPYVLPALVLLCVACAAAQRLSRWNSAVQVALAIVFTVSIQAAVLVPCVSPIEEYPGLVGVMAFSWYMAWADAVVLSVAAAGLLHAGHSRGARAVAAVGLALAAGHFALGATKYYLRMTGMIWEDPFVAIAESRAPVWLIAGTIVALIGTTTAHMQRWQSRTRGAAA